MRHFIIYLMLSVFLTVNASEPTIPIWDYYSSAEPMPKIPHRGYFVGMWEDNWMTESYDRFKWKDPVYFQDIFVLSWTVRHSEPEIGYPYHYGNVTGINDTVKVRVFFDNRSASDFILTGEDPET